MSFMATVGVPTTDARTGLPVPTGVVMTTVAGVYMSTCPTGAAKGSLNTFPGTDPNVPGNSDPGVPYGFTDGAPSVGPLTQ